jgi:Peptidase inhibitor family I36
VQLTKTLLLATCALCMVVVTTFAPAASGATAAVAPRGLEQCQPFAPMCFWHNQGYRSTFFSLSDSESHLGGNSDEAHSVWNRSTVAWILYDDNTFDESDRHFCIRPGHRNRDIGAPAYKFGDKITSAKRLDTSWCPPGVP